MEPSRSIRFNATAPKCAVTESGHRWDEPFKHFETSKYKSLQLWHSKNKKNAIIETSKCKKKYSTYATL